MLVIDPYSLLTFSFVVKRKTMYSGDCFGWSVLDTAACARLSGASTPPIDSERRSIDLHCIFHIS